MVTFEEGQTRLRELVVWYADNAAVLDRNEATTRLQLIDRLFFDCLGWNRAICKSEESHEGKFCDYAFYCPERLLIVEAKREGIYFELPIGRRGLVYGINYFFEHAKDVGEAVKQAVEYCQSRGTPFGVVCNGHQVVAFVASRNDGRAPLDAKALVFDSMEAMEKNFLLIWQCLSPEGIANRRLALELQDAPLAPVPEKLSAMIQNYPRYKLRNSLQADLQVLAGLFIEDIAKWAGAGVEEQVLKEIYCESGALSQYAAVSKDLLRNRYSQMYQEAAQVALLEPATKRKGLNPEMLRPSPGGSPVLLIGDRGVGKSIFIKHLYLADETEVFKNSIVLYIDFGSQPAVAENLEEYVAEEIESQLREKHGIDMRERNFVFGVLNKEIQGFEKGVYSDLRESSPELFRAKRVEFIEEQTRNREKYLAAVLSHITRGRKKQIVLFLDNGDHRPDDFQERVFMIGQTIGASWPVTVFVSIRPETFYKSRVSGTFSAYRTRAFTISPPRVDEVVSKRLRVGLRLLKEGIPLRLGEDISISVSTQNLQDYLQVLLYSFEHNRWLIEFLDNMCGGNIRLALDLIQAFIGSGHVYTEKILSIYRGTGQYVVALHEFTRAVTYGDYEDYSPKTSEMVNLFDISTSDPREHFLSPILLGQMNRWAEAGDTHGYVSSSQVMGYLQDIQFQPSQVKWHLDRLLRRNLIEQASKVRQIDETSPPSYRATNVGAYYVKRLMTRFTYVDAMTVDTPITSESFRPRIAEAYYLKDRLDRAQFFIDYLDAIWKGWLPTVAFDWPRIRQLVRSDIAYVTSAAASREDATHPPPLVGDGNP